MNRLFTPGRYANVTATIALVLALTGGAYAAGKITSKQIGNGQVKKADLHKNAVTGSKVKNGSLSSKDFKAGDLPAGAKGEKGDKGDKGDTGPIGPTTPIAVFNIKSDGTIASETHRAPVTGPVTSLRFAAGRYDVTLPGIDFDYTKDVATCTGTFSRYVGVDETGTKLVVWSRDAAGTPTDGIAVCAVYRTQ